jgi:hypothetical protein
MTSGYFFAHYNSVPQFICDSTDLGRILSYGGMASLAGLSAIVPRAKQERTLPIRLIANPMLR